jgi:hypothetical protein
MGEEAVSILACAAKGDWDQILNTGIAIVAFLTDAGENWRFSRFGTHRLKISSR